MILIVNTTADRSVTCELASALSGKGVDEIFKSLGTRKLNGQQDKKPAGLNIIEEEAS